MEIIKCEFVLLAEQAIAHHSESLGNFSIAMRRKTRQADGSLISVPIITGDTMRHGMREAIAYKVLSAADLLSQPDLNLPSLRLLFSGGMITGAQGGSVNIAEYNQLVDALPSLELLGGCTQNRAVPGRLTVSDARLICTETAYLDPVHVSEWLLIDAYRDALLYQVMRHSNDISLLVELLGINIEDLEARPIRRKSCRAHIEEVGRTRGDPSLDPAKQRLLSDKSRHEVIRRLKESEKAGEHGDPISKEREKCSMMPRSYETVVEGSLFYWYAEAICFSFLDVSTFYTALFSFLNRAYVGGKKGSGQGKVVPIKAWSTVLTADDPKTQSMDIDMVHKATKQIFIEHLRTKKDQIKSTLDSVKA